MSTDDPIAPVEYRHIPGHPDYRFGDDGSAWSRRWSTFYPTTEWHRLEGGRDQAGYRMITFDGRRDRLHVLILRAFLGPRPPGMLACHRDDDKENNRLVNLYYGTLSDNARDGIANGKTPIGDRRRNAKLREDDVEQILYLRSRGFSQAMLAARFGVCASRISFILRKLSWSHVTGDTSRLRFRAVVNRSRFTDAAIVEIRRLYAEGASLCELERRFNASKTTVWKIATRRTYANLEVDRETVV